MKHITSILLALALLLVSCGTAHKVPITGRTQHLMVSDAQILSLSNQQYAEYMGKATISKNVNQTAMVQRVGKRLAAAVEAYLRQNGMASELQNFAWEFNLVQNASANAFCMPGGKIVVYEGIFPVTQSEDALAIVLGHEIAHALAKHSAEQLSKKYRQQLGLQVGASVLASATSSGVANLATLAAQQGLELRNLKYSRDHENEADHIGLILAAMAGYNPNEAVTFWERMASYTTQQKSEFLSDHPSDAKRVKNIQKWLPEAMQYYNGGKGSTTAVTTTTTTPAKTTSTQKTYHFKTK